MTIAESGEGFARTVIEAGNDRRVPGSDLAWLADGYAAVTALRPLGDLPDVAIPTARSAADAEERVLG